MLRGYHECPLSPSVSVKHLVLTKKKRGDSAVRITDDGREPTWIFATRTDACACMFPSINCELNHLTIKILVPG